MDSLHQLLKIQIYNYRGKAQESASLKARLRHKLHVFFHIENLDLCVCVFSNHESIHVTIWERKRSSEETGNTREGNGYINMQSR